MKGKSELGKELGASASRVSSLLRQHLMIGAPRTVSPAGADPSKLRTEMVPPEEIVNLCHRLDDEDRLPTPEVMQHVYHEILWILADATLNGSCAAVRMLATHLLTDTMNRLNLSNLDDHVMNELVGILAPSLSEVEGEGATG